MPLFEYDKPGFNGGLGFKMRNKARQSLERAKALIAQGDEPSARHACLELRFSIEYLVYDQLNAYLEEVADDTIEKWTPKQIIAEMMTIDPNADKSSVISVGIEEVPGVASNDMKVLGEDRRFSLKWANSTHNALGNFLHAPTLYQVKNGQTPTADKILRKARETADTIDHILRSPIFNVNFGCFYEFECECGRPVKRRNGSFKIEDGIKCPSCGAIYDLPPSHDSDPTENIYVKMRKVWFACFGCGRKNYVGVHQLEVGREFACQCGARSKFDIALVEIK